MISSREMKSDVTAVISWSQKLKKSMAVSIWLEVGLCRLALAVSLLSVPPIPSHGDFPWLVAKNDHVPSTPKSFLWLQRFKKFLQFLYYAAHPSEK